jgi:hypothetical protein
VAIFRVRVADEDSANRICDTLVPFFDVKRVSESSKPDFFNGSVSAESFGSEYGPPRSLGHVRCFNANVQMHSQNINPLSQPNSSFRGSHSQEDLFASQPVYNIFAGKFI